MDRHLTFGVDLNCPVFSSTATTANVNARLPMLPGILAAVGSLQSGMTSSYHSLQVTTGKRFRNHFSVKSFCTLAKGLSGAVMQGGTSYALVQDFRNMALDHARLDNHRSSSVRCWFSRRSLCISSSCGFRLDLGPRLCGVKPLRMPACRSRRQLTRCEEQRL